MPPIREVLRDLARGRAFPTCGMSGPGNSASHQWASAPDYCPPQYTRVFDGPSGPVFTCDYSGAVTVSVEGAVWARTWWGFAGDTVTEFTPAAKAQLGTWDTKFDTDYATWLASLPPPPRPARRAEIRMDTITFSALAMACAPLVHASTAQALVAVESGFNPHAIGVVGGVLERQPRNRAEALATAEDLQAKGWNFSVGLAQINARNFERLGLTVATALDPCENLRAMQTVLGECMDRTAIRHPSRRPFARRCLATTAATSSPGSDTAMCSESRGLCHKAALPVAYRPDSAFASAPSLPNTLRGTDHATH